MERKDIDYNKYMELKDTLNCKTVAETTGNITILFEKEVPSFKSYSQKEEKQK